MYNLYFCSYNQSLTVLVSIARNRKQKSRRNQKLTSSEEIFSKISSFTVQISRKFISSNVWLRRVFLFCFLHTIDTTSYFIVKNYNSLFFSGSIEKTCLNNVCSQLEKNDIFKNRKFWKNELSRHSIYYT